MLKINKLLFFSILAVAAAAAAKETDKEKVQSEIRYVGYECDKVEDIKQSIIYSEVTVICDQVYKYIIKYDRGGAVVEVLT